MIDFRPWTKEGIEERERKQFKQAKSGNDQSNGIAAAEEMMEGLEFADQEEEDGEICSDGQQSDYEEEDSCGPYSENEPVASSEHSRRSNTEDAEEVKS